MSEGVARHAAERAARDAYGRLLSLTARRSGDIAAAEDALSDAFCSALAHWPVSGVPDAPEAWLLTAARRTIGHAERHAGVKQGAHAAIVMLEEERNIRDPAYFPDKRLELLFLCAHPAIDAAMHTPLMLQTILGLDAARIAAAFLLSPAAVGQRLVRAKTKIRDAGISFTLPDPTETLPRLSAVLDAIYVAFGTGWDDIGAADPRRRGLTDEALYLSELLINLLPDQPESHGLLALILYCEARAQARREADGQFVPLDHQDISLWSRPMIARAEHHLRMAAQYRSYGRYQTEAAIQSLHIQHRLTGMDTGQALLQLYDLLARHDPAIGALVARAVARGRTDPQRGLPLLDALPTAQVANYQPYWAARAHLLRAAGRQAQANSAYDRAIGLTQDPALRTHLTKAKMD